MSGLPGESLSAWPIEIGRLAELALSIVQDGHSSIGIGAAAVALDSLAVERHRLHEVTLSFADPPHRDLHIGLLGAVIFPSVRGRC